MMCMVLKEKEKISHAKQFVFVEKIAQESFMSKLGYKPNHILSDIEGNNGVRFSGYEISCKDTYTLVRLAQEEHIRLEQITPEVFEAISVGYNGEEAYLITKNNNYSAFENRIITKIMGQTIIHFLDVVSLSTGKGSFYNTPEELQLAEEKVHQALFEINRGLYGSLLTLNGTTDRAKQLGVITLLSNPIAKSVNSILTEEQEGKLLTWLISNTPITRVLKLFEEIRRKRINNARTKKLILRTILASEKLELWATKYRRKLISALEHALSKRVVGILASILAKNFVEFSQKEKQILAENVDKYLGNNPKEKVYECIKFILRNEQELTLPLLNSYHKAKAELEVGKNLSYEVLEGIRSTFHKNRVSKEVFALTCKNLTATQKLTMQTKAEESNVKIAFDPLKYEPSKLYLYGFEKGLTAELSTALLEKAEKIAKKLPISFEKVGIVIDASLSMRGSKLEPLKPMAVSLALRDVIKACSTKSYIFYCGGKTVVDSELLVEPEGDTDLSEGFMEVLKHKPEAIFIISDGYENAPSGLFSEVLKQTRKLGITTPIYHLSPVMSSEAHGIKGFGSPELISMPILKSEALGTSLVRGMLAVDVLKGIKGLLKMSMPNFLSLQVR